MYDVIHNNLHRQSRGLDLLYSLLDEEFELLVGRKTDDIMALEFSIHELVRQLAVEKAEVRRLLGGGRVADYASMLDDESRVEIQSLWSEIDDYEQRCSRQASQNAELSLALLDQSKAVLTYLHTRVQPQTPSTYARTGVYMQHRPVAALISGRL